MPLTPFHLGPASFLAVIFWKFLNFWALVLGSSIMDLEPLLIRIFPRICYQCRPHGFFHTIIGAVLGSIIVTIIVWFFRKTLKKITFNILRQINIKGIEGLIEKSFSLPVIFFSSLIGWLIHIFFDSLTHYDVYLFWPVLKSNPILIGPSIYWTISIIFIFIGLISLILAYIIYKNINKNARH